MKLFHLCIAVFFFSNSYGQLTPEQKGTKTPFSEFIRGVKYAEIYTNDFQEKMIAQDVNNGLAQFAVADFLKSYGFEKVGLSAKFRDFITESYCDMTTVAFEMTISGNYISVFNIIFQDCKGGAYLFGINERVKIKNYDYSYAIGQACRQILGDYQKGYSVSNRIKLKSKETGYSPETMKAQWKKNGLLPIEGFYNQITSGNSRYKLGLIKDTAEDRYQLIYFEGASNFRDWNSGDLKAILLPTSSPSRYSTNWYMGNKILVEDNYIEFTNSGMVLRMGDGDNTEYAKIFPTASDKEFFASGSTSTGSGFAVSKDGIIATNAHVIEGAKKIVISGGVLGTQKIECEVLLVDTQNDLALLKIKQGSTNWNLPYSIDGGISQVGTSVFTLGYPLIESMGSEIKLTNGIISSKTGFQGDFSMYQTNIAVQPGNSGGPLLSDKGTIVGVISAKHRDAENASYAIKANYLLGLLNSLDFSPILSNSNRMLGKSLSDQVEFANDFVFVIEAELTY